MRTAKIIGIASPICWWRGCVGQFVSVLDVYEPTGYVKIRVVKKVQPWHGCIDPHLQFEGWIPPEYIEIIK